MENVEKENKETSSANYSTEHSIIANLLYYYTTLLYVYGLMYFRNLFFPHTLLPPPKKIPAYAHALGLYEFEARTMYLFSAPVSVVR